MSGILSSLSVNIAKHIYNMLQYWLKHLLQKKIKIKLYGRISTKFIAQNILGWGGVKFVQLQIDTLFSKGIWYENTDVGWQLTQFLSLKTVLTNFYRGKYCVWKLEKDWFVTKYVILKTKTPYFKNISWNAAKTWYRFIYMYLLASKYVHWMNEWRLWMLNNTNCVPDEKDSWKHVYDVYFSCT